MKKLLTKIIAVTKNQCPLFVTQYQNRKNKQFSLVFQKLVRATKSKGAKREQYASFSLLKSCKDKGHKKHRLRQQYAQLVSLRRIETIKRCKGHQIEDFKKELISFYF